MEASAMTRVSIIADDDSIVIDRVAKIVDCAKLREAKISAVQWYDDHGEIEYARHAKPNKTFDSFEEFQSLVDDAKPVPSPKPPTPQELDEMNNRYLLEYPDARKPWDERHAEHQRLLDEAVKRDPRMLAANKNEPS
jgi:hypothetical protein